jgi:hypothetical protein
MLEENASNILFDAFFLESQELHLNAATRVFGSATLKGSDRLLAPKWEIYKRRSKADKSSVCEYNLMREQSPVPGWHKMRKAGPPPFRRTRFFVRHYYD